MPTPQVLHLIGAQGAGKSTLAALIAAGYRDKGQAVAIISTDDEAAQHPVSRIKAERSAYKLVILEAEARVDHHDHLQPGDWIVTLERPAPEPLFRTISTPAIGAWWPGQGGYYAGLCRGTAGQPDCHLILSSVLPADTLPWQEAFDWAKGLTTNDHTDWSLPTRAESALLFANLKDQFEPKWYWTSEQLSAAIAWGQWFVDGFQNSLGKSYEGRARAVRRLVIQPFNPS